MDKNKMFYGVLREHHWLNAIPPPFMLSFEEKHPMILWVLCGLSRQSQLDAATT